MDPKLMITNRFLKHGSMVSNFSVFGSRCEQKAIGGAQGGVAWQSSRQFLVLVEQQEPRAYSHGLNFFC